MYQFLIAEKEFDEYYEILEKIAIVEMHHFKLLGETIKLLGLKPTFNAAINNCFISWSASNANYNSDLKSMLKIDIATETMAIENYYQLVVLITDKYIRNLLYRIIEDEKLHLQIFNNLYRKLGN